jgi:xylan 1,4-beta-xylosidase
MRYRNPVIPGSHPDPSVCRAGEDYFLVTSSFEYFPGIPLFHSRDLVNWRQIGHCLTRPAQLDLAGAQCSDGVWAAAIRYHGGVFYVTSTNVRRDPWRSRNFLVCSPDPWGEWSDPSWLDEEGIDPELFFDDGSCYYVRNGPNGIWLGEVDLRDGAAVSGMTHIWGGTGGAYPEGPHVYKVHGRYYLMIAEGGTGYAHMTTIARSHSLLGPYAPCPRNPILSHRHRHSHPIQCTGHADLIEAHNGSWWLVFLGVRDRYPGARSFHLGRETLLAPVSWDAHGWPVVNGTGTVETEMEADCLPRVPWELERRHDDFDSPALGLRWNSLREPLGLRASLSERPGWLRLRGGPGTLDSTGPVAFVGQRQCEMNCRATALLDFEPVQEGEEAGLTVLMSNRYHYEVGVVLRGGVRQAIVRRRTGDVHAIVRSEPARQGPYILTVNADPENYTFTFAGTEWREQQLASLEVRAVADELAGTFTGVYLGLYASGNGRPSTACADFDWFEVVPTD